MPAEVSDAQRSQVKQLLINNLDLFAKHDLDCGKTDLLRYKIELTDSNVTPHYETLRRHPQHLMQFIDDEVDHLVQNGIVEPCGESQWCSNLVLVKRKSLPGQNARLRVTVDLRAANKSIKRLQYPMPDATAILNSLQGTAISALWTFVTLFVYRDR